MYRLNASALFTPTTAPVASADQPRRAGHAPAPRTPAWPTATAATSKRSAAPNRGDEPAAASGKSAHVSAWSGPLGGARSPCVMLQSAIARSEIGGPGVEGGRGTYQGDAAVVDEVEHADAGGRLCDEVREPQEGGAASAERGQGGDGGELCEGVDAHEHLRCDEVLAEPEEQPSRCARVRQPRE